MGNAVDPTGLSFTVTKIDGTTASVSPQTLTPTTWGDTVGTQTCTFTYSDGYDSVSCDVEANVQAAPVVLTSLSVTGTPATQYVGNAPDLTGLTFTAVYSDTSEVPLDVSDISAAPATWSTTGSATLTCSYTEDEVTVSANVSVTVSEPVFTGISVSGTPAKQRANTQIDTTGLTVYANYSDGSHVDVTSESWIDPDVQGALSGYWGNCITNSDDGWYYPNIEHHMVAGYNYGEGSDDQEYNANSSSFYLEGEMPSGTSKEFSGAGYITCDVPHLQNMVEPWDGSTGGFLITGTTAGNNAYMLFTKAQYDNDTAVDLQTYGSGAPLFGIQISDTQSLPGFGWRMIDNTLRVFVMSIDGTGTDGTEGVLVIGELANNIDPSVGIKKSDFVSGYSYYNFSIAAPGP